MSLFNIPEELPEETRTPEEIEESDKAFIEHLLETVRKAIEERDERNPLQQLRTYEEGERPTPEASD